MDGYSLFAAHGPSLAALTLTFVSTVAELRVLAWSLDRLCGGKPQVSITNQVGMVCDEATRMRLIKQREELLAKSVAPAAMTLPEPQPQLRPT